MARIIYHQRPLIMKVILHLGMAFEQKSSNFRLHARFKSKLFGLCKVEGPWLCCIVDATQVT